MLLLAERHTVGALVLSRVAFVGADRDTTECAVVCGVAVVDARGNIAFDAFVLFGVTVHVSKLLFCGFTYSLSAL